MGVIGMVGMSVKALRASQDDDSSKDSCKDQVRRRAGPITCQNATYRWPLSHRGHKGTAEEDIRLY